jgi:Domain of Unknown Function (DUF1080)/Protein of unknown function (DUF2961)
MISASRFKLNRPLTGLLTVLLATSAVAAEPARLNLVAANSLTGWDHGPPAQGWKVSGTTLTGSAGASELLSGFTFGDFSLKFQWNVAPQGTLRLMLPQVPSGEGLQLKLSGPGQPSSLSSGAQVVSTDDVKTLPADKLHTAELDRAGDRLTLRIDNQKVGDLKIDPQARFGLGLATDGGQATLAELTASEPEGESIFNGQDLTGWWSPLGLKSWQVTAGAIENLHKDGNYLRTDKSYGNFTLAFDYKAARGCNSGIGIRTAKNGWPSGDGFELQILDAPGLTGDSTMSIYRNVEPLARADHSEEWNSVVIKADGPMISAWMNDQLMQQTNTIHHPELKHRHPEGWIGLQDHGGKIEFRNLRVLEAPSGPSLAAWYAPRVGTGTELVCDRLLNPETLSLPDRSMSGVAAHTATEGEETLAQLTGPGVVTRIWRSGTGGRLAFYFDDQSKPAIECAAVELSEEVPLLFEQKEPILTCLPYESSLRIVARGAKDVDYRIEYVKLPRDVPVESFRPDHPVLPRGWLAAIDYRGHQYRWGTHREADPEPRTSGEVKSLEPGQSAPVASRQGNGIVQWMKLQASVALLTKDDLWLEVLIDGETEPAIAAPARYFFPSLAGGENHDNFLAVFREGFTSMLAMPYSDGIVVRARNAGSSKLGRVAVTLSVIADDPSRWPNQDLQIDRRMRLRGRFHVANDSKNWLEFKGAGRWIGLVTRTPKESSSTFAQVTVDDKPLDGWQGSRLDSVLGGPSDGKDFFHLDAGRARGLAWRYWQLAPIEFQESIVVSSTEPVGDSLGLVYVRK